MYVPDPQNSQKRLSFEELPKIVPLACLGLLHKVGWALGNDLADLYYHRLQLSIRSA